MVKFDYNQKVKSKCVCVCACACTTGAISTGVDRFGIGDGLILLDNLLCTGNENRLLECPANDPGLHNCQHNEDSGVICQGNVATDEFL